MRILPQTALGQIVGLVATALIMTFGISVGVFAVFSAAILPRPIGPLENALAIVVAVHALEATQPADRQTVATAISSPHVRVRTEGAVERCAPMIKADSLIGQLLQPVLLGPAANFQLYRCDAATAQQDPELQLIVPLAAGQIELRVRELPAPGVRVLSVPVTIALVFLLLAISLLATWAAWRITRPLRQLAETAEAFGTNIVIAPLEEQGPREIRQVTHAFNRMQHSIATFMHDRSRMLAAISHDLRTPLTRLKLRVEFEDSQEFRAKMLRDIAQLERMIDAALVYLRGQTLTEERDWIDLGALLATICDEFNEMGANILCENPSYLPCLCQPLSIRRAITNLVDNAKSYGTEVKLGAQRVGDTILIDIEDNGPGIKDADKERALRPFSRLDSARAATGGNVGLGLAIVADVARAHAGTLDLLDRAPRGLTARLTLKQRR